jgi:hypothetical protein
MRKAAGIILIALSVYFICSLIATLVVFGIDFLLAPFFIPSPQGFIAAVVILGSVALAAFYITCGIFCLRRKYWRVCLASASFAVLFSVWGLGGSVLSSNILMGSIPWGMLVAEVIAVIFIVRTKKEWQETSDSVGGKVSYGGEGPSLSRTRGEVGNRMRKAAGILMIIPGAYYVVGPVVFLIQHAIHTDEVGFSMFLMICGAFMVTGGIFCVKKKYWRLCLASASLAIVIAMYMRFTDRFNSIRLLEFLLFFLGSLSIVFVYVTRKEWIKFKGESV